MAAKLSSAPPLETPQTYEVYRRGEIRTVWYRMTFSSRIEGTWEKLTPVKFSTGEDKKLGKSANLARVFFHYLRGIAST